MFYVSLNVNFRKIHPGPTKQPDTDLGHRGRGTGDWGQNDSGHPRLGANCLSNICVTDQKGILG